MVHFFVCELLSASTVDGHKGDELRGLAETWATADGVRWRRLARGRRLERLLATHWRPSDGLVRPGRDRNPPVQVRCRHAGPRGAGEANCEDD